MEWYLAYRKFLGSRSTIYAHRDEISRVIYSPDRKKIASCDYGGVIKIWDAETRREIGTLSGHEKPVQEIEFSPSGKRLLSGSYDDSIRIWDVKTGECVKTLDLHDATVSAICFSADKALFFSGDHSGNVFVWDASNYSRLGRFEQGTASIQSLVATCLLYTSPSPRDKRQSRMPSSA